MRIDLDDLLLDVNSMGALPPTAARLTALLSHDDWDLAEIAGVVTLDPVLTARVLRAANSAAAGSLRVIPSVREAVLRLGAGMVISVAVSSTLQRALHPPRGHDTHSESSLWRHSVAALCAVELMRRACGISPPAEAYTAALLHDVGKLVLSRHLTARAAELLERARHEGGLSSVSAERELLEVDHAELGALVAQHWALPAGITAGIQFHHCPEAAPDAHARKVARVVCLANLCARQVAGAGPLGPGRRTDPTQDDERRDAEAKDESAVLDTLDVSAEQVSELRRHVEEQLEDRLRCYAR